MLGPQKQTLILKILATERRWYEIEIVDASDGKLSRSTIYVRLGWLEKAGLVESREEDDSEYDPRIGIRMRFYRITEGGMRQLAQGELAELGGMPELA